MAKDKISEESLEIDKTKSSIDLVMAEVTLECDHTDNGIPYKKGDKIKIDPTTLRWLIDHNIVKVKNA
jgi:hypothetical protein